MPLPKSLSPGHPASGAPVSHPLSPVSLASPLPEPQLPPPQAALWPLFPGLCLCGSPPLNTLSVFPCRWLLTWNLPSSVPRREESSPMLPSLVPLCSAALVIVGF